MRAVRYHGPKQPLRLEDVPIPAPGPDEVLVKVTAAGICHTELHFLSGLLDLGVRPITLGHEIVGRVERVGAGVEQPGPGERVIVYYYAGCGRCAYCRVGEENLCAAPRAEYGFVSDGGFAEFVRVPARNCVPLPDAVGDALAKHGRLVFIGYSEDSYTVHPMQLVVSEARVTGSVGNTLDELYQAVDLVARGCIETVVDCTLPFERFQLSLDALGRGELVGRAVLIP